MHCVCKPLSALPQPRRNRFRKHVQKPFHPLETRNVLRISAGIAYGLIKANVAPPFKVRALGVTVSGFDNGTSQITLDEEFGNYKKFEALEKCVDEIRKKHGYDKVQRARR